MIHVHASVPSGFINIDCGLVDGDSLTDSITNLTYVRDYDSDVGGIHQGVVPKLMNTSMGEQEKTLRSFPDGQRNCYTLPSTSGKKYLIRATFTYGNYDGLNSSENGSLFQFGLHIGVNVWTTVNLTNWGPSDTMWKEVLTVAPDKFISVCLINLGSGTPFISTLEMRPLDVAMYPFLSSSVSASYFTRKRFGEVDDLITRYPIDSYDRFWESAQLYSYPWLNLSTNQALSSVPGNDNFQVPMVILQKATTINSNFSWLNISVRVSNNLKVDSLELLPIFHFAEIENSSTNRTFDIYSDDDQLIPAFSPSYLQMISIYRRDQYLLKSRTILSMRKTNNSKLPPFINAFEAYVLVRMDNLTTNSSEVSSMKSVKMQYNVPLKSWNGDPCSPKEYTWEGVRCNYYDGKKNPRITLVNLSASRISGNISLSFRDMSSLEILDLSHNNLSGIIPYYELDSLKSLNLSYNQLSGSIPDYLFQRYKAGSLDLRLEGNPMCINVSERYCVTPAENMKKKNTATLLTAVLVPIITVLIVLILWMLRCKGKSEDHDDYDMYEEEAPLHIDTRRFTYTELKIITNNFQSIIGKGGFGTVYHGILDNGDEVAVKVLLGTSIALSKDFLPEVQTLSKVHHKNLVTLVGYCQNKKCLALVYDFMPRGNVQEVLRGLEYLHESCTPAIVHRDVKTANILLDENLVAMISDFGLSRSFTPAHTHISTVAAGTVGYLDPEYHATFQLTMKADVYSFGIVLLEIITSQPSVLLDPQPVHLPNWVRQKIATGSIHDAVDSRLMHQYDATSLQSVIDLAMNCVQNASIDRPSMTDVVSKLKECLPAGTSENRLGSESYRQKETMDSDIARQFQLLASGVPIVSSEGASSGTTELSYYSGR
uniref:Protein kinase domain-containing protein n=1 Tax=Oryza brachyantha TaxID=4533 RepID=J3L538_ORYBR